MIGEKNKRNLLSKGVYHWKIGCLALKNKNFLIPKQCFFASKYKSFYTETLLCCSKAGFEPLKPCLLCFSFNRVPTVRENLKKSGNFKISQKSGKSQGISKWLKSWRIFLNIQKFLKIFKSLENFKTTQKNKETLYELGICQPF